MFSTLSKKNRFLKLTTPLGADILTPINFIGTETLSRPFEYRLDVVSSNLNIEPKALLHKAITLEIAIPGSSKSRYFNGIIKVNGTI
jgi:type VI secretion system secreted protein VgrG